MFHLQTSTNVRPALAWTADSAEMRSTSSPASVRLHSTEYVVQKVAWPVSCIPVLFISSLLSAHLNIHAHCLTRDFHVIPIAISFIYVLLKFELETEPTFSFSLYDSAVAMRYLRPKKMRVVDIHVTNLIALSSIEIVCLSCVGLNEFKFSTPRFIQGLYAPYRGYSHSIPSIRTTFYAVNRIAQLKTVRNVSSLYIKSN